MMVAPLASRRRSFTGATVWRRWNACVPSRHLFHGAVLPLYIYFPLPSRDRLCAVRVFVERNAALDC